MCQLYWSLVVIWYCFNLGYQAVSANCTFTKHGGRERKELQSISQLLDVRLTVTEIAKDGYVYKIGICSSATHGQQTNPEVGVIQMKKDGSDEVALGKINQAEIMGGDDWVLLEYEGGDHYGSHCSNESRRAYLKFTCSQSDLEPVAKILEENNKKVDDCYYLFEIFHSSLCKAASSWTSLSAGTILIIVLLVLVAVYLVLGFLYQRLVVGAQGLEQIPNMPFWRDFGALQADGCNFLCRCGSRGIHANSYRGIGDDQLHRTGEVDQDDHLLPM